MKSFLLKKRFLTKKFLYKEIKIGNFQLPSHKKANQEFIPSNFGFDFLNLTQNEISYLKWMGQKDILGQDMFLIGHPGNYKRNLAFLYCHLTNNEIEFINITKDTTEHDLKQRREILNGQALYVDQCAVRSALNGRILIIEGKKIQE